MNQFAKGSMREAPPGLIRVSGVTALLKERPLLALAGAGLLGAALGGLVFSRAARLLFVAAGAFAAAEIWKQSGGLDVRELLDRVSKAHE